MPFSRRERKLLELSRKNVIIRVREHLFARLWLIFHSEDFYWPGKTLLLWYSSKYWAVHILCYKALWMQRWMGKMFWSCLHHLLEGIITMVAGHCHLPLLGGRRCQSVCKEGGACSYCVDLRTVCFPSGEGNWCRLQFFMVGKKVELFLAFEPVHSYPEKSFAQWVLA